MRSVAYLPFHALHFTLLRGASLLVPFDRRGEWYQEWAGELWHARHSCRSAHAFSWAAERELASFCLGSYQDAACLLRQSWSSAVHATTVHGSARQCLLCLATVVALLAMIAHLLPGIRSEQDATANQLPAGVMVIQQDGYGSAPSIPVAEYRDWNAHRQRYFNALAFYRSETLPAATGSRAPTNIARIAFASENLFRMLGADISAEDAAPLPTGIPSAVLSRALWRGAYHSSSDVIGQILLVGSRPVRVVGIAPTTAARLPGSPDLWILASDEELARSVHGANGYLLGQLSPAGQAQVINSSIAIAAVDTDGNDIQLHGFTFGSQTSGVVAIYLFALFLAVLALPAISTVFSTESDMASHQLAFAARARRSAFLGAKLALVASIGYFGGLDIAYFNFADYAPTAEFLQFLATFGICLFSLRWALKDQSRRCPVCLRCVTHPAQVGIASCNFLGWNGTEMICMGGHALLHVPGLPTSWFSRQRWLFLDTSWDFLFADPVSRP